MTNVDEARDMAALLELMTQQQYKITVEIEKWAISVIEVHTVMQTSPLLAAIVVNKTEDVRGILRDLSAAVSALGFSVNRAALG